MADKEEAKKPTVEERMDALHDHMSKMSERMDAFMAKHSKKDDADDRKDESDESDDEKKGDDKTKKDAKEDGDGEEESEEEKAKREAEKEKAAEEKGDKKDAAEGEGAEESEVKEGEGKPKPMASKDRKDESEDDDKSKKDADERRSDSALRARLDELERAERRRSRQRSDEEANTLAELQGAWDSVAQAHGERASRPLDGESVIAYDRRHAKRFQKFSDRWGKVALTDLPKEVVQTIAAPEIRADAIAAAHRFDPNGTPALREVVTQDRTGRNISTFVGNVRATLAPFMLPTMRVKGGRINKDAGNF